MPADRRPFPVTPRGEYDMLRASGHQTFRFRTGVILGITLIGMASGACSDDPPSAVLDAIDRETFIEVYVDLRHVALRKVSGTVNSTERDSVLALHEVSEEDLRLFLEVYHTEADYMRDLWNDVEARISLMLGVAVEGSEEDG